MNKLIDVHVNSILLYVTIPPPPRQRPGQSDPHTPILPFPQSPYFNTYILQYSHTPILYCTHSYTIATTAAETTEQQGEGEEREEEVTESSVDRTQDNPNEQGHPPTASEGARSEGSEISPPEAPPPSEETVDMTKDRPLQRSKPLSFSLSL